MKVAINGCYGGFGLSPTAIVAIAARKGITLICGNPGSVFPKFTTSEGEEFYPYSLSKDRTDPDLIYVIEQLGDAASGRCAKLRIVDIPDDIAWEITEYDGMESVEEIHRSWS